jgi:SAM-dependent methyltransferase
MYEASPFPPWDRRAVLPLSTYPPVRGGGAEIPNSAAEGPVRILCAGAGTGQVAAALALAFGGRAFVEAVDLSATSLAYGVEHALRLGLSNISWTQADLLTLTPASFGPGWAHDADADAGFDVVQASGVLMHLHAPEDGFARLAGLLRVGGLLDVAVYARAGRAAVRAARRLIAERKYDAARVEDLRAFRADVLAAPPGTALASLEGVVDFRSAASLRDLAFHVQDEAETNFSWEELRALLVDRLGLDVVQAMGGSDPAERRTLARFRAWASRRPGADERDLEAWSAFETEEGWPNFQMYHVIARKRG